MKNIFITLDIFLGLLWIISSGSCIYQSIYKAINYKIPFSIVFERGSSPEELIHFVNDLKTAYPKVTVEKILNDEESFYDAAKIHNIKPEKMEEYKKALTTPYDSMPTANIDIKASMKDLGTEKKFNDFISQEFNKYKSLKIRQFGGSASSIKDLFNRPTFNARCINPYYSILVLLNNFF